MPSLKGYIIPHLIFFGGIAILSVFVHGALAIAVSSSPSFALLAFFALWFRFLTYRSFRLDASHRVEKLEKNPTFRDGVEDIQAIAPKGLTEIVAIIFFASVSTLFLFVVRQSGHAQGSLPLLLLAENFLFLLLSIRAYSVSR